MGLSIVAPVPDYDQQLKAFNAMGAFDYVTPGQWVGDARIGWLGEAPASNAGGSAGAANAVQIIRELGTVYKDIQAAKQQGKAAGRQRQQSTQSTSGASSSGSVPTWLWWAGGAVIAGLLIYMLLKKKNSGGGDYRMPVLSSEAKGE